MATAKRVKIRQTYLNAPGPSGSRDTGESLGESAQFAGSQGSLSQLRVSVTVLRADNIPDRRKKIRLKRLFVTVSNRETTAKTESVQVEGQTVKWDQKLDAFLVQSSSRLILRLYAKRLTHPDVLIGTQEALIPHTSQSDLPIIFKKSKGGEDESMQPITLYLTITVSANMASSISLNNTPEIPTKAHIPAAETTMQSTVQGFGKPIRRTAPEPLLPLPVPGYLPVETGTLMTHRQAEVSHTENARIALRRTDKAKKPFDRTNMWERAVRRIKWVMDTLSPIAELHPFAKMTYGLVSAIPRTLLEQYQRDDNVRSLLEAIHDAFDFAQHEDTLKSIKPDSKQSKILTLMLQDVCNCCDFVQSYAKDTQFWKRTLKNMGGGAEKKTQDLSTALVQHRRAFLDQATLTIEITAFQILDGVGILSAKVDWISTQLKWVSRQVPDAELDAKIREIPYGTRSRFAPDKGCLMGTRTYFLDFIVNWINDPASERSLVLFGQAGTGKSSIAHEIARRFDKMHRLTSSFIFSRKEHSKREVYHLFTTLARDLSDRYPSFKTALGRIVKNNSSLRTGTRDYGTLFESLILEPLKGLHIVGPILVVIDALDESGDVTGGNSLHTFLAKALAKLPSHFRVLITSRPEHDMESTFVRASSVRIIHMDERGLATKTHDDIISYLREKLPSEEFRKYGNALAIKAEGLFQWAAVACGYILKPPASFGFSKKKCIEHLLRLTADDHRQDPLDELYKEVLEGYFTHQEARILFRSVIGQLITAFEPLSIRSLTTLRYHASNDDDHDSVVEMLRHLGSLLSNVNSANQNLPMLPLHTSFRDFLTSEEKSGDFCVHLHDAHDQLARSCLGLLINGLKFNICNFESSYLANKDIKDLDSRVGKHIPPALLYACRFWGDHLEHINFETGLFVQLRTFFEEKFLFWLEALSVTSNVGLASPSLSALNTWLASGQGVSLTELEKLKSFVDDASVFVRYFGMAMAKSAPHVYLSTLPFAPTGSLVSAHYSTSFPRLVRVKRGRLSHWPSSETVISNVGGDVLSIALSPDGQRIVSGSSDRRIRVWNAITAEAEAGSFTGHTDSVRSVAFSPDGQRIVSGSDDRTIRVWNAITGETLAGPFTKHTSWVLAVAFSPDSQRIVSGSSDGTIRVWNATTGETETGPFTGHRSWVTSVVFSPDGRRIVSGSYDGTIRMWNAMNAEPEKVAGPFTGHTDSITSVAFSPDGQRIVSGSYDQTIRVWNTTTGEKVAGPFSGHTNSVLSVAFSPDCQFVVSGSSDQTIRVWDAGIGNTVAGPFTGHRSSVTSVAFSPDGQRVVSCSYDQTIRVWNAMIGNTLAGTLSRPVDAVTSVAFSPDGQRIVSGSDYGTIRVWNATTGEKFANPFTGHMSSVKSVAFSPDGQRIISGSSDGTIRVWNVTMGNTAAGPFCGHTRSVRSVAISPDGQRIVSGSSDTTIRMWDAATGEEVAGPFTGHTGPVKSVAFSPDGQRVVSSSNDGTIHVWNATTAEKVARRFTGHTSEVFSVAFSPGGQRIVSGSSGGTIHVWDAMIAEKVAGPFIGHKSSTMSVAFSPDGQRIVSGSSDRTIRMWDATTGEGVAGPFTGHTHSVASVAFSPDGQQVVSGSFDGTIRVWNVTTGEIVASRFAGHTDPVASPVEFVAFSSRRQRVVSPRHGSTHMLYASTVTKRCVDFTDHSEINDEGWICGAGGELLLWIPPIHRIHLHRPSNIWVSGDHETRIDLSTSVHGRSWATCID